jgi:hypothetical protein
MLVQAGYSREKFQQLILASFDELEQELHLLTEAGVTVHGVWVLELAEQEAA